ncbi:hypothetical protein [Streptomyces virginiae]|uniref:Uncharacterized protein n=1 Tax=Streptomyces virginiae TaxID=1961 RepID=A0ABZ1TPH4_STRVG|nr:hypothetical protein [Streptomyces virginiae]
MDSRKRKLDGASTAVAALAEAEPLLELPTRPFPAELETRVVSPQGLISFAGNYYSVSIEAGQNGVDKTEDRNSWNAECTPPSSSSGGLSPG